MNRRPRNFPSYPTRRSSDLRRCPAREDMRAPARMGTRPRRSPHIRSEEHTSEVQSPCNLVGRLLLDKKETTGASSANAGPGDIQEVIVTVTRRRVRTAIESSAPIDIFFNDTSTAEIYTLSLHDPLSI